jgi:hypothetical protein
MKKDEIDELRPEYRREDLGPGVRGKYLEAFGQGPTWCCSARMSQRHFQPKKPSMKRFAR